MNNIWWDWHDTLTQKHQPVEAKSISVSFHGMKTRTLNENSDFSFSRKAKQLHTNFKKSKHNEHSQLDFSGFLAHFKSMLKSLKNLIVSTRCVLTFWNLCVDCFTFLLKLKLEFSFKGSRFIKKNKIEIDFASIGWCLCVNLSCQSYQMLFIFVST